jgi:methionine synthase II (cobalamin-independent)
VVYLHVNKLRRFRVPPEKQLFRPDATRALPQLNGFYLESDRDRAGGFEPRLHLPAHKNVIVGVITSKFPELEDKAKMKGRILAAADVVAKEQSKHVSRLCRGWALVLNVGSQVTKRITKRETCLDGKT